jgi:ABC-type multidrug transport system fused ATPase/permease subunit
VQVTGNASLTEKRMMRKITAALSRKEKKTLVLLTLADAVISIADIAFLGLLVFVIHVYTDRPVAPSRLSVLLPGLANAGSLLPAVYFFLFYCLKNALGILLSRAQYRFLLQVSSRISAQRLVHYLEGSFSHYIHTNSATHIQEINYYPLEFCQHVLGGLQQILTQGLLIAMAVAGIVWYDAKLFLLLFAILLPPVFLVFYFIRKQMRSARLQAKENSGKALQYLQEALAGFVESNVYQKNPLFLQRFIAYQRQFNTYITNQMILQAMPGRIIEVFALLGFALLVVINRWFGNNDHTTVLTIGVFIAAAYKIIPGIVKILNLTGLVQHYSFTIPAAAAEPKPEVAPPPAQPVTGPHSIQFSHIGFSYGQRLLFSDVNLEVNRGDFIGISGASGKGKTTLLHLLLGFLTPQEGDILFNGQPTRSTERHAYWKHIAYVKQQPFLLHDTIRYNITFSDTDCDEQRLQKAVRLSGLDRLLEVLPEKLDKVIRENGRNISGGQRQRIAIARALYKDAHLIILDEPFNELDEPSEERLLQHFQSMTRKGKTVILITHNRKSLSYCNKTFSLDAQPA